MLSHVLVVVLGHSERRVWDRGSAGSVIGVERAMPVDCHGPTQAWNSPLHQVYEILQEATAETRILPLVGQQEAGGCLKGGGVLVEKQFCSFFNPLISLYIHYDQYEKIWRKNNILSCCSFPWKWRPYSI